jgi:hypothetical protein
VQSDVSLELYRTVVQRDTLLKAKERTVLLLRLGSTYRGLAEWTLKFSSELLHCLLMFFLSFFIYFLVKTI